MESRGNRGNVVKEAGGEDREKKRENSRVVRKIAGQKGTHNPHGREHGSMAAQAS